MLNDQARACASLGSPLYAFLLERAADDVARAGPVWGLLRGHEGDPLGSALALRLMGAVHRLVLSGSAPDLARYYSAAPGAPQAGAWPSFVTVVEEQAPRHAARPDRAPRANQRGRTVRRPAARLPGGRAADGRPQDAATVVFHSIVVQYLTDEERSRLRSLLYETGRRTRAGAPLAWLRMEPAGSHAAVGRGGDPGPL